MRLLIALWLLMWALCWGPTDCFATSGSEYQAQEEDFVVTVDSRWAGSRSGGYHPIRIRIQNRADTRDMAITFRPSDRTLPTVSRTVNCPQNASTMVTLPVPMVGAANSGALEFISTRGRLRDLGRGINIAEQDLGSSRPGLLVISPKNLDYSQFESAVSSTMGVSRGHFGTAYSENSAVVQPTMLPNMSIAFSGLDLVALPLATLEALNPETRDAILNWTRTGGTLLISEAGEAATDNVELRKLTGLDRTAQQVDWIKSEPNRRSVIQVRTFDQYGNETGTTIPGESPTNFQWSASDKTFAHRDYGLGQLIVFAGNPFPGTVHDWAWFMNSTNMVIKGRWAGRLGINGRGDSGDFYHFLIPGIQTVPVYSFLLFITLFAVVIGPLNYFFLARRNRLNALIVTVPTLAIITSVALFVFSAVAHGFSVKGRIRSLTVLDQGLQTAVIGNRLSLYAGMVPSNGLQFSPDTVVIPLWPRDIEFEGGSVDWTQTQHLTNGFLRARTKTQYHTLVSQPERGRITVEAPSGDAMKITNGLEWQLDTLVVGDDSGELYIGHNVAAGTSATLKKITNEASNKVVAEIRDATPALPDEYTSTNNINFFTGMNSRRNRYGYWGGVEQQFKLQDGQLELRLAEVREALSREPSKSANLKRRYFATIKHRPGIETGTKVDTVQEWHALMGYY